jgi:site-specific recombinase XerC
MCRSQRSKWIGASTSEAKLERYWWAGLYTVSCLAQGEVSEGELPVAAAEKWTESNQVEDRVAFAKTEVPGNAVLREHFTPELCRRYQYSMAQRGLEAASIRVRLAVLASFGKWSARRDRLSVNPLDMVTRPRRKSKLPVVPRWTAVETILGRCRKLRDRAVVALLGYGGLRRSELVSLDVGDYDSEFGLRRVKGKGEQEAAVALPQVARRMVDVRVSVHRDHRDRTCVITRIGVA